MRRLIRLGFFAALLIPFIASYAPAERKDSAECDQISSMRVYSNAWVDKETGDLNGFELAIRNNDHSKIEALLYVYEGGPAEGIPLPGRIISNGGIDIAGDWIEHMIEYPSKKERTETHSVKMSGVLKPASSRGKIHIQGYDAFDVKLKRVDRIWMCKP
ncbi:MAG: hypothetical protein WBV46_11445 [Terriglobales bacterium]|jgi:hypothetical protein